MEKAEVFPAVRYKALDYVFEAHSSVKVLMNLLTLPAPYLSGTRDPLATLAEDTFRTPWTRGNCNTKCRLGGSAVDDLRGNTPADWLERFDTNEEVEVIPSSNPNSPGLHDQEELQHILNVSLSEDPCDESFPALTTDPVGDQKRKDLRLPEDIMVVDFLPHFRKHLPSLKTLMSRLKTLPVVDPLQSRPSDTEELTLRHCEVYKPSPSVNNLTTPKYKEEFSKEPSNDFEELLLPDVVGNFKLTLENCIQFSKVCLDLKASPEKHQEDPSILELLQPGELEEISKFVPPELSTEESSTDEHMDTEMKERLLLPTDLELDVTVTPTASPARTRLSTSDLLTEPKTPIIQPFLLSARARLRKERSVWKAEKHLKFVLYFLFAEPDIDSETSGFHPLSEALKLNLERETVDEPQTARLCRSEFTEKFKSVCRSAEAELMEDSFPQLQLHSEEYSTSLLTKSPQKLKSQTAASPSTTVESLKHSTVSPATAVVSQGSSQVDSGPSRQTNTEVPETRSAQSSVSSSLTMKKNQKLLDSLSTFMMLRSQLKSPVTEICDATTPASTSEKETLQSELHSFQGQKQIMEKVPSFLNSIVAGNATRESTVAGQTSTHPAVSQRPTPAAPQDKPNSHVVEVRASDSQRRAYQELLTFAQPILMAARELGVNPPAWRDFGGLSPDQTRYVLKQQELALRQTHSQEDSQVFLDSTRAGDNLTKTFCCSDQLLLFNHVAVIHVLVTFKDLLLQCDLRTALDYLVQAAEMCMQQSLELLVKKMTIIHHIHHEDSESSHKLQQLQQLVHTRMDDRDTQSSDKILIIMSVDRASTIIQSLSQLTVVTSARPEENQTKLLGSSLVSSVCDSLCVLVYEQHIGPDFPWSVFSLVLEFDQPGLSPWISVCRERNISHLRFSTQLPDDEETSFWCLEEEVPYMLIVTDGLVNCPLLLQSLESGLNVTVLERSVCQSLQMSGGTQNYSVITVDEATAIIIQESDELHRDGASERVVMRLSALSLQYSCCWIILYWRENQGGGLSSEAFSNLLLLYSSLVMFNMKPEDLDVKLLIANEVLDMAQWISRICFHSMMSSERDPVDYLDRDWLTVTPSQDELSLSQFPSVTSLVAQLMLKRAPSLSWLLEASLPQMKKLLPEVPEKVLMLFCETTSLYLTPMQPEPRPASTETPEHSSLHCRFWSSDPESPGSEPFSTAFLVGPNDTARVSTQEEKRVNLFHSRSSFSSPDVSCQSSWDLWREENRAEDPGVFGWTGRSRAADEWIQTVCSADSTGFLDLSPATQVPLGGHRGKDRGQKSSSSYGSKCWIGEERKRRGDVSGLPDSGLLPVKSSRLSYERVPGRSDGQTRLRLF